MEPEALLLIILNSSPSIWGNYNLFLSVKKQTSAEAEVLRKLELKEKGENCLRQRNRIECSAEKHFLFPLSFGFLFSFERWKEVLELKNLCVMMGNIWSGKSDDQCIKLGADDTPLKDHPSVSK